jgi:hypothetical protein
VRVSIPVTALVASWVACAVPPSEDTADIESELTGLASLYEAHDYFRLRERLEPLVLVHYGSDSFVCRFDTGANKTAFYEPFFRRYRSKLETQGEKLTAKTAGVGGPHSRGRLIHEVRST